jgi:hypothetical protein
MSDPWEETEWLGWEEHTDHKRRGSRWPFALLVVLVLWQLASIIPSNAGMSCASVAKRDGHATAHTVTVVSIACPIHRSWHIERWPVSLARGSAFRVGQGHWLTAAHVVKAEHVPSGYQLRWYAIDQGGDAHLVRNVQRARKVDAASFDSDASGPLVSLARNEPSRGDRLIAWGQADLHSGRYRLMAEEVARDENGHSALVASPAVEHGYSGGPALNDAGEAVGIVYAITDGLTVIVPISSVRGL